MEQLNESNWSWYRRTRSFLFLTGVIALVAARIPILAEDETLVSQEDRVEVEGEIEEMGGGMEEALKLGGLIECDDTSCKGAYSDLIASRFERSDGYSGLIVTEAVKPHLAASSINCQYDTYLIIKNYNETSANRNATVSRWVADLSVAEALDQVIRFTWRSGSVQCMVNRIYKTRW